MKTSQDLILTAGGLLFGSAWQSDLANALGINRRTVQRWRTGEDEPRTGVWSLIIALVDERIEELTRLRATLAAQANEPGQRPRQDR